MSDELAPPDMSLALDAPQNLLVSEWLLGTSALLMQHQGAAKIAELITYRGRVAVIELDGPHHRDRASADHSRDRQLRHAGLSFVERLNVEEVNTLAEVEKFVGDFLAELGR